MSDSCQEPAIGKLLTEYELGLLDDDQREQLELHLMECEFCFKQVEQFAPAARFVRSEQFREVVRSVDTSKTEQSLASKMLAWLWPSSGPWLKPAIALIVIVLLLPFAWQGLKPPSVTVRTASEVVLTGSRGGGAEPRIIVPAADDLVVRFGFEPLHPDEPIAVRLLNTEGELFYTNESFRLDAQLTGRLTIPAARVSAGTYRLILRDPSASGPLAVDTLTFTVSRPVN